MAVNSSASAHLFIAAIVCMVLVVPTYATSFDVSEELLQITARQEGEERCKSIRLPRNLCTACKLKPFTGTGKNVDFGGVNRYDIYDLSSDECKNALIEYSELNECDTRRARAIERLQNSGTTRGLEYFMYSVCETCCDCIPIGSRPEEYEERKAAGTLIHVDRGNCAAHFRYDTCVVWPQVSHITGPNGRLRDDRPQWCQDFLDWQMSEDSKGWIRENDVPGITRGMRRAMKQLTKRARCGEETQWKNCVALEMAQGRV